MEKGTSGMARVITRIIRSERRRAASVEIEEELKATWARLITPRIEGYFNNVVGEWSSENQPQIVSKLTDLPNGFEVWTGPTGGGKGEDIWNWITNGLFWAVIIFTFPSLRNPGAEKTVIYLNNMNHLLLKPQSCDNAPIYKMMFYQIIYFL